MPLQFGAVLGLTWKTKLLPIICSLNGEDPLLLEEYFPTYRLNGLCEQLGCADNETSRGLSALVKYVLFVCFWFYLWL